MASTGTPLCLLHGILVGAEGLFIALKSKANTQLLTHFTTWNDFPPPPPHIRVHLMIRRHVHLCFMRLARNHHHHQHYPQIQHVSLFTTFHAQRSSIKSSDPPNANPPNSDRPDANPSSANPPNSDRPGADRADADRENARRQYTRRRYARRQYRRRRYARGANAKRRITEQPIAKQPIAKQPIAKQPIARRPIKRSFIRLRIAKQPIAKQPIAKQPIAKQPIAKQPITKQPIAKQPIAKQPIAKQPIPRRPYFKRSFIRLKIAKLKTAHQLDAKQENLPSDSPPSDHLPSDDLPSDDLPSGNLPSDIFSIKIRHLMRHIPHNLTAIVAQNTSTDISHPLHGLLASSFTTITLSPKPYISFNVLLPSQTYDTILASDGLFTASGINDAKTAKAFAKISLNAEGEAINVRNLAGSSGRLKAEKGGVWWMRCVRVPEMCVRVGDHAVVVAEVLDADLYSDYGWDGETMRKVKRMRKRKIEVPDRPRKIMDRALVYAWGTFIEVNRLFRFVESRYRGPSGGPRMFRRIASRDHIADKKRVLGRGVKPKSLADLL